MRIECTREGRTHILRPYGVMAGAQAEAFEEQVREVLGPGGGDIVIDISNLGFVDSRGLEALVSLAQLQIRNGRMVKLAGEQPIVREVLELTELAPLFQRHGEVREAIKSCQ
ncbi:MAG: hypothetical protein BIFFINMI_02783 [Phycisphaerae bacterium]|nr:hypothetical protein [Phycisphaerae bacterium]